MIIDEDDDEICKEAQGTEINWKEGKNVTLKTVKKKQKHRSKGNFYLLFKESKAVREVVRTVEAESFFNFFKSRKAPEVDLDDDSKESDEEEGKLIADMERDFTIAEEIANNLVETPLNYYMNLTDELDNISVNKEVKGSASDLSNSDSDSHDDQPSSKKHDKKRKPSKEEKSEEPSVKKECKQQ